MKRTVFFFLLAGLGIAIADDKADPLSCIDPLIAAAFLTGFGSQEMPAVKPDIPEQFSGIGQLDEISFLGNYTTGTNAYRGQNLGFVSDRPVDEVEQKLERFLRDRGWDHQQETGLRGVGFRQAKQGQGVSLCSDKHGMANVMVRQFDGQTIANVMSYRNSGIDCATAMGGRAYQAIGLNKHMPKLDLPEGAQVTPTLSMGSSSNSRSATSRASFQLDMEKSRVLAHFDRQVETQGWTLDSGWDGQQVAGSSWTKVTGDHPLVGIMTLVANGQNFAVRFEIQQMP